ncbi:MAG: restriction endonuclease [Candidatus Promineifilaceae bacterium]
MADLLQAIYFKNLDEEQEIENVVRYFRDWVIEEDESKESDPTEQFYDPEREPKFDSLGFYRHDLKEFLSRDPYSPFFFDDPRRTSGLSDFDDLYYLILPMFASDSDFAVELDLTEIIDSAQELSHDDAALMIGVDRIRLRLRSKEANEVFQGISGILLATAENQAIRLKTLEIIGVAESVQVEIEEILTAKEKGDFLEDLVGRLFNEEEGFVVDSKVKSSSDEIDLVVVNKVNDPFWISLHTPFILIECRNWKDKTEPKHIRDFEGKILDRKHYCKLGVFIATGGYKKGCFDAVAKMSRENYKILLIDNTALRKRTVEGMSTANWLEKMWLNQF